ncbi:hypothetical protein A8B82_15215 [Sulfitobacter sp. EhC04]|uniref:DUF1281 family ferredoxin-like fold protein n=1 Tax=Sulfitobacter sp. EhC04 TaxID=1849168 RepID=UPI0007F42550|nr:hypothetical protein [Sulfitobacter sp. EhC04]OAN76742.1 hypothetical protein A8B82_15215 [Sulfitobacter sp. EhC04]
MPNHVINRLTASPEILDALKGNGDVDFNALIPMPKILKHTASGSRDFDGVKHKNWFIENPEAPFRDQVKRAFTDEEIQVLQQIGFSSWYDWSIEKWGVKWNAYAINRTETDVTFQTAWSSPKEVFEALSGRFPDEEIRVEFADEDIGSNCGTATYRWGNLVDFSAGNVDFAHDMWGHDEETRAEMAADHAEDGQ